MALVLVLATVFLAASFGREALAIRQKLQVLEAYQAQVADLRQQRDELKRWLDVVQSPEHMRRIGHDQMMMGFPGEERWVPYVPRAAQSLGGGETATIPRESAKGSPSSSGRYWSLWEQYLFR